MKYGKGVSIERHGNKSDQAKARKRRKKKQKIEPMVWKIENDFFTKTHYLIGQGQAQNRFIQLKLMPGVKPGIFLSQISNDYSDYTYGMRAGMCNLN